jgi:hypothetical protein
MTYILHTTGRSNSENRAVMILACAAAPVKRFLTATAFGLISLPAAISAACVMTYVDPYQPGRQRKDHSNPQNF